MSKPRSTPSVALFPFLAVLICMMGALILLLVVTTRRIRQQVNARELAAQVEPVAYTAPAVRPPRPVESDDQRAARAAARQQRADDEADARQRLAALQALRDERLQAVEAQRQALADAEGELERARGALAALKTRAAGLQQKQQADVQAQQAFQTEQAELNKDIAKAQQRVAALKRKHAEAQSQFAFVPYDGALGTTRRPLFVECTSAGLRILPENELLGPAELKGFTERYNPLLVGTQALSLYWTGQADLKPEKPDLTTPPYVLLLVRPSGTVTYYLARRLLSHLGQPFGYELIEENYPLYMPEPDPQAKVVLHRAIEQALRDRQEVINSLANRAKVIELEPFDGSTIANKDPVEERASDDLFRPVPYRPDAARSGGPASRTPGGATAGRPGGGLGGGLGAGAPRDAFAGSGGGRGSGSRGSGSGPAQSGDPPPADIGLGSGGAAHPEGNPSGGSADSPAAESADFFAPQSQAAGAAAPVRADTKSTKPRGVKASAPRTPAKGIVASESDGGIYPEEETIQAARGEPGSKRRNPLLEPSGGDGGGSPAKQGGGNLSGGRSSGSSERDGSSKHEPNAKQRWGRGRGRSTIGLERKVDIHVAANRIIIGGDGIVVPIEHGVSREKLVEQVLAGMDEAAREWNDPPEGFHYVPTVKFRVYPGGNQNYERVNGALKKMGLVCSAQFAVGDRPPAGRSE